MSLSSSDASSYNRTLTDEQSSEKSSSDQSGTGKTISSSSRDGGDTEEELARRETVAVFRLRILVFFMLFLAAAGVSAFVYMLTNNSENEEYLSQLEGSTAIILETFEKIISENIGAVSTISVASTAHSLDHNRDWPFVSLSSIQQRFSKTNELAGSLYLEFSPLVEKKNKDEWEVFTNNPDDRQWIMEGLAYQEKVELNQFDELTADDPLNEDLVGTRNITYDTADGEVLREDSSGPFLPVWQTSPVLRQHLVNKNHWRDLDFRKWSELALETKSAVFGGMKMPPPGYADCDNKETQFIATILSMNRKSRTEYLGDPVTDVYIPVFDSFHEGREAVAILRAVLHWRSYFKNILPPQIPDLNLVLKNSCEGSFTYVIMGETIEPLGEGDLHEKEFSHLEYMASFDGYNTISDGTELGLPLNKDGCIYSLSVYPTRDFFDAYNTSKPMVMAVTVAMIFIFTTFLFLFYDRIVERRQKLVLRKATQSTAIVSSLFPKNVRDRLLEDKDGGKKKSYTPSSHRIKNFLGNEDSDSEDEGEQAIADLFPECTVMFADIVGFTAWSSARDPSQVFNLLQTIYEAYDNIAKRRRVFKVETIGDCYVAVTGLPDRQPDHAIRMAKFAAECRVQVTEITKILERTLGPDTGDLGMRFGLHSGAVTAGVLRGDRSRFQLFGDTVNTAARMESTGAFNKIHASQATASRIIKSGKEHWLIPREDTVTAKGKGVLTTYWLNPYAKQSSGAGASTDDGLTRAERIEREDQKDDIPKPMNDDDDIYKKEGRRIDWIANLLAENIQRVIARREAIQQHHQYEQPSTAALYEPEEGQVPFDEVVNKMILNRFDTSVAMKEKCFTEIKLDDEVLKQLRDYVAAIAATYLQNPFHNFEHACHVTMSVVKLLKRIVMPEFDVEALAIGSDNLASQLHDYTYGITSDPMAVLAIIFSALIHDVDHRGVSNVQLGKEEPEMADHYDNRSIAEQNSLDVAWHILMRHQFKDLRNAMFANKEEIKRFRQVVVNVVLATDIFDKELNSARKDRWNLAFSSEGAAGQEERDLKATIVIEHIIQASDVSHTMQHWHVYRRWNERLFREMSMAFRAGRMGADPATFWYKGELGFFDNYIIPLAEKLKECGVFGVSSDEYLAYAKLNREEWEVRGEAIVEGLIRDLDASIAEELSKHPKDESSSEEDLKEGSFSEDLNEESSSKDLKEGSLPDGLTDESLSEETKEESSSSEKGTPISRRGSV